MAQKELDDRILNHLVAKLGHGRPSIKSAISRTKTEHGCTSNAAAKIYADKNGVKVNRWLTDADRESWKSIRKDPPQAKTTIQAKKPKPSPKPEKNHIIYQTNDRFVSHHIREANICYNSKAYTAAFILCRKIIENLLIKDIICKKYSKERANSIIYTDSGNFRQLSKIIEQLKKKRDDFGSQKTTLDSLLDKTDMFRDKANKTTHSSYELVRSPKDFELEKIKDILDLIKTLSMLI